MSEVALHISTRDSKAWEKIFGNKVYHTGVQVQDIFYEFSDDKIKRHSLTDGKTVQSLIESDAKDYGYAVALGSTNEESQSINEWLGAFQRKCNKEKFSIMKRNDNNFSDEFMDFLVGKGLPSRILHQRSISKLLGDSHPGGSAFTSVRLTKPSTVVSDVAGANLTEEKTTSART